MSTPYDTIERLIDKYTVADVLLIVGDICELKAYTKGSALEQKWLKSERIIKTAVKDLPKGSGIK